MCLNFSYKTNELKQIYGIFPKYLLNDLIVYKLREIVQLQDFIKSNELQYTLKQRKIYNFSEYALSIDFLRDVYERILTLEEVVN